MPESDVPSHMREARAEPWWHVRVNHHNGIEPSHRNSTADAVVADISLGGLRLLSTSGFEPNSLIQLDMVRPSKKNPAVGQKFLVVARVLECRKVSHNGNGNGQHPQVHGKRITHQLRAQFLSLDEGAREWVRCVVAKRDTAKGEHCGE